MQNCRHRFVLAFILLALCGAARAVPKAEEVPNFKVRVRVLKIGGQPALPAQELNIALGENTQPVRFSGGEWSPWLASTREGIEKLVKAYPNSYNSLWQLRADCVLSLVAAPSTPKAVIDANNKVQLQVETAIENGETSASEAELFGARLGLLLWRDLPANPKEPAPEPTHIDTLAGHGRRVYQAVMRAAFLPPADRPKKITFADRYIGGDDDAIAWTEGVNLLAGMGINALHVPPNAYYRNLAQSAGINRTWGAVYNPPGYAFNFKLAAARGKELAEFAHQQIDPLLAAGWTKEQIALWVTSDEPGWYYPATYEAFNADENARASFHAYLQARGFSPPDFGKTSWGEVQLIGRREYSRNGSDVPSRRLFYWSNRFVPWASTRYFAEVSRAYENAVRPDFPVMVNFNNFAGTLYNPGPVANNPHKNDALKTPNAAMGQHDWLEWGRERGSTAVATEDWFNDSYAPQWSFYAARLRSAAALSGTDIGALIIPRVAGQREFGVTQKIMALVGHGSKHNHFFIFGPEYSFPSNCYSENPRVLKGLSAAMKMTARAEDLLFPGRERAPQVGILSPQSSQLWDLEDQEIAKGLMDATNVRMGRARMAYMSETFGLFTALQHAAIPVRFVDEERLAEAAASPASLQSPTHASGERGLNNFKVLYVTAPDLPAESVAGLLTWVRAGGTLITTAGAGLFDRYHQADAALTFAAGSTPEAAIRQFVGELDALPKSGSLMQAENELTVFGEREKLAVGGARVTASFSDGTPAITENAVGRGRIIRFALHPGISYLSSSTGQTDGLNSSFSPAWRELIIGATHAAGVQLPVAVSAPMIEAPALYSENGVAVTLLNWSGAPQQTQLTIAVDRKVRRVESVVRGAIPFQFQKNHVSLSLPIGDVDVLKIYYRR